MAHLPYDICLRLRDAGLPQPENPEFGQIWYLENQTRFIVPDGITKEGFAQIPNKVFCPDAEYLAQHLNFISPPENPTDPPEKGILNFFVRNYLHRHEKTPAP